MVRITCYGQTKEYKTRQEAIAFFRECYYGSEGAEQARYSKILMDLMFTDKNEISDEE